MADSTHENRVLDYYDTHPINEHQILEKLALDGVDRQHLSEDVLKNYDQDHYGGVEANDVLAQLAGIDETTHVLDVCAGMGGPARYLAHNYGCQVTGVDLTESRVDGAKKLTAMVGLEDRVTFVQGNALQNPFADRTFDVVVSQEAFCHVPDKPTLISECIRVLKPGGRMAFTDIVEHPTITDAARGELVTGMAQVELGTLSGYQSLLENEGCTIISADDLSASWTAILVERLAMYRSLKNQTVDRFGADHFQKWDDAYSFFVGLFETGDLGGGRFLAQRNIS